MIIIVKQIKESKEVLKRGKADGIFEEKVLYLRYNKKGKKIK